MGWLMRTKSGSWSAAIVLSAVLLVGCSSDNSSSSSGQMTKANPSSSELFDWSYGYLLKGDSEFTRMAPNQLFQAFGQFMLTGHCGIPN